ncbi:hypothetical protein QNI16_09380 [Cytophagaceae bacterium YF14B1]|uniref:Lipoprotein n=1 Tax=Xanthocytophaga flava TaxID=3048013 RepID=A0AAE3U8H7_9BACT|nr:hypothetical protein [Xanthocytophaga flavus]MDJ1480694.1 hypothetical protein [Xanthocytophaga flavus]
MKTKIIFLFSMLCIGILVSSAGCRRDSEVNASETIAGISNVDGIYIHLEYEAGVGGGIYPVYNPYLFFTDGSVYKNMATSPEKLDVVQSKQQEPKEWGTWKKSGSTITIAWNQGDTDTWDDKSWHKALPAGKNELITGSYNSISGGGNTALGGDIMIVNAKNLSFDGSRFTYESTSGGGNTSVTAYSNQAKAGTYKLNGYSIEYTFNNGTKEIKFFYFYPDSKTVFGVGDRVYVLDK